MSNNDFSVETIDYTALDLVIGELEKEFTNFEVREQQMIMWRKTFEAMLNNTQLAIHAPTGTGKSLGYIVPAMAVKLIKPDFKATFSTYTLNLQEQLLKDLELGIKLFKKIIRTNPEYNKLHTPKFVIIKGTKNYFCRNRLDSAPFDVLSEKRNDELRRLSDTTKIWDRQALNIDLSFKEWETVNVQSCVRSACPFFKECTYAQTYNNLLDNDFFILNHSLFLTRFFFVEKWEGVSFFVFDEGHKLEKSLLDTYTFSINKNLITMWKENALGIAAKHKMNSEAVAIWLEEHFSDKNIALKEFIDMLDKLSESVPKDSLRIEKTNVPLNYVKYLTEVFVGWMSKMFVAFNTIALEMSPSVPDKDILKTEISNWLKSLIELKEFASVAFNVDNLGQIWFDYRYGDLQIKTTPKNTKYIDTIFDRGSLVTSGTLAENDSCSGFAERMRMNIKEDIVLTSPFMLAEQTMVYVSRDINPKKPDFQNNLEYEIMELIKMGKQKVFVLFTSSKLMKDVYKNLLPKIKKIDSHLGQDIEVWLQDKGNNKRVISSFKDDSVRSVLFGTLSYFEGIDLKGESLTQIILTRLPFSVPTHPVQEILDSNSSYSQWEAVVRYEQAFGRLIRTEFDYGAFCLLDNRVSFMRGFLTPFEREGIPISNELSDVERFFKQQS